VITKVADPSQVAEARRLVGACAQQLGVAESRIAHVALAVTELATNLLKHAGGGEILAHEFDDRDGMGLEILALDKGPGMANVQHCLRDGYSTAGSPGTGLGAISRQSEVMEIYSRPGQGTAIMLRFVIRQPSSPPPATQLAAISAPYPGETLCGDRWRFEHTRSGRTLLLIDGTGHGVEASRAADTAVRVFEAHSDDSCERLVDRMHRALAQTRGGALAVARLDEAACVVRYVGIGNISGVLVSGGGPARHMVSNHGTAGHSAPRIREFVYPFGSDPLLILHSDGLTTRWDIAAYPGLVARHPALIAGVLLRDHRRARDDASVVVIRALR
jgi:anti-sigma regulatory factor (Ser/Thr protein kinase)